MSATTTAKRRKRCPDCGRLLHPREVTKGGTCLACGVARQTHANNEQRHKEGPTWERIVRSQYAYWSAEVERLGLLSKAPHRDG